MTNLVIYCCSAYNLKILDKLPPYIKPLALGDNIFPEHWLNEKKGENISSLNKYYGEHSGVYWIWKNKLKNMNRNDWVGICHYRKLWLNDLYQKKQKFSFNSLYANLLKPDNEIFLRSDAILVQPIILKNQTVFQQFDRVHKNNILENCVNFLENDERKKFQEHLDENILYPLNLFITKVYLLEKYCENIFPWLKKCFDYCKSNNFIKDYNIRLPSFLSERYCSYWFSKLEKKECLSYARLGTVMLSNNINKYINPIKIPFTFRMYPTLHDY